MLSPLSLHLLFRIYMWRLLVCTCSVQTAIFLVWLDAGGYIQHSHCSSHISLPVKFCLWFIDIGIYIYVTSNALTLCFDYYFLWNKTLLFGTEDLYFHVRVQYTFVLCKPVVLLTDYYYSDAYDDIDAVGAVEWCAGWWWWLQLQRVWQLM